MNGDGLTGETGTSVENDFGRDVENPGDGPNPRGTDYLIVDGLIGERMFDIDIEAEGPGRETGMAGFTGETGDAGTVFVGVVAVPGVPAERRRRMVIGAAGIGAERRDRLCRRGRYRWFH